MARLHVFSYQSFYNSTFFTSFFLSSFFLLLLSVFLSFNHSFFYHSFFYPFKLNNDSCAWLPTFVTEPRIIWQYNVKHSSPHEVENINEKRKKKNVFGTDWHKRFYNIFKTLSKKLCKKFNSLLWCPGLVIFCQRFILHIKLYQFTHLSF